MRAIVYTAPGFAKWRILLEGANEYRGLTAALQEFWKDLEREMERACGESAV